MRQFAVEKFISIVILVTGLTNIWSALSLSFPDRLDFLLEIFPFDLLYTSRSLVFVIGFIMIILASNIWKRKRRAWLILIFLLVYSALFHLLKDLNIWLSFLNFVAFILLWYFRSLFSVQSESWRQSKAWRIAVLWICGVFAYAIFGFFLFADDFSQSVTLARVIHDYSYSVTGIGSEALVPKTRNAFWFTNSITVVAIFGIASSFSSLFFPYIWRRKLSEEDKLVVQKLLRTQSTNSTSYFALSGDKQIFFNQTRTCFLSYKISQKLAIVLGDPVGQHIYWQGLLIEFIESIQQHGLNVAFINVVDSLLYKKLGFSSLKIGEEAMIDLSSFSVDGSAIADVRHSINRMNREGAVYHWHRMDTIPWKDLSLIDSLHRQLSGQKKGLKMTFSVDFYPFPIEPDGFVLTVFSRQNKLLAVLSFLPFGNKKLVLELMLRSKDSPNGTMEAALGESILFFQKLGYVAVSLGLAPLSDLDLQNQQKVLGKTRQFVFNHFNQIYKYKSLFHFKKKFQPQWESRYLIYKNSLLLPQVITALIRVHLV